MASPPIPFDGKRSLTPSDPTTGKTLMGWNQLVFITGNTDLLLPDTALRVTDYNIGIRQEGNAPDYITGRQDRTAWMKGPVISEGDLAYPFTYRVGANMFAAGAGLVFTPQESFSIQSSAHPRVDGCKIQTVSLSCNAGEEIQTRSTVWGIVGEAENDLITGEGFDQDGDNVVDPGASLLAVSSADGDDARRSEGLGFGSPDGVVVFNNDTATVPITNDALALEQIPQWDVVRVEGTPCGMHVVGFSLEINNNLVRNYTMGDGCLEGFAENTGGASPFGLNATTISANQRRITGTISWQSDMEGTIAQIIGTGLEQLRITISTPKGGTSPFTSDFILNMRNCLWNAQPPSLSATDRVVVETTFTALGANETGEFDALEITMPDGTTVGL